MDSDEEVGLEIDLGQTSTNVSSEDSQSQQSLQTESTTESHDLKESEVFPQESVKTEPDVREKPRDDEESDNESLGVHHSHRKAQPLTCSDDDEDGLDRKFESVSKIPKFKKIIHIMSDKFVLFCRVWSPPASKATSTTTEVKTSHQLVSTATRK